MGKEPLYPHVTSRQVERLSQMDVQMMKHGVDLTEMTERSIWGPTIVKVNGTPYTSDGTRLRALLKSKTISQDGEHADVDTLAEILRRQGWRGQNV